MGNSFSDILQEMITMPNVQWLLADKNNNTPKIKPKINANIVETIVIYNVSYVAIQTSLH